LIYVDLPIANGGSFHGFLGLFTRGPQPIVQLKSMADEPLSEMFFDGIHLDF
jgi:hypothetical protein